MSTYKQNLESLRKRYPVLADAVDHLEDDYTVKVKTVNGNQVVMSVKSGSKGDTKIWDIHSSVNPVREAENFVENFVNIERPTCIIVLGLGMGYYFDALMKKYGNSIQNIIIVENNLQIFKKFIEYKTTAFQNKDGSVSRIFEVPFVHFIVGTPADQIFPALFNYLCQHDIKSSFTSTHFVEHPVLIRFNKDYYKPIINEMVRACIENASLFGNDPEDSWMGIDHMLMNLDVIAGSPGLVKTKDMFKGRPAVIVATGPSLNKNIHLLPKIKGKAVFFSADASLKTLLTRKEPIIPDIVTSLERNLSTCNHFTQIPEDRKHYMKDIWLGACPVVKPEVYKAWPGKNMMVFRKFAQFEWIKVDRGIIDTGKSVTNLAFSVAEYMGCDPIILVGQDLSFAPDGNTHADGADHAREGMKKSPLLTQRRKVMGNDGTILESLETWVGMLKRFQWDISKYSGTCVNATEGGAKIEGAVVMTLEEAISKYMTIDDFNAAGMLDKVLVYPVAEEKDADISVAMESIKAGQEYVKRSLEAVDGILDVLSRGFENYNGKNINEAIEILIHIDKMKVPIFTDPMCYLVAMHILQSWCIGHINRMNALKKIYRNKSEYYAAAMIREYEFNYGLKILFKMIDSGIRESIK